MKKIVANPVLAHTALGEITTDLRLFIVALAIAA